MTGFLLKRYIFFFLLGLLLVSASVPAFISAFAQQAVTGEELPPPLTEKIIVSEKDQPKTTSSCGAGPTLAEKGENDDPFEGSFMAFKTYKRPKESYDFSFIGKDLKTINLSHYKGKYVLLHFWASWCRTCVTELPSIVTLQKKFEGQNNLAILPIATDINRPFVALRGFLDRHEIKELPVFYDREIDIQRHFAIRTMPSSYILDPNGRILHEMRGPTDWSKPEAVDFIKGVISQ